MAEEQKPDIKGGWEGELLENRVIIWGSEAVQLGLATHLSDTPRKAALDLAREIANKSPDAIRAGKQLLSKAMDTGLGEGLQLEERLQLTLINRPNQLEAVQANLQKRPPQFHDPE